MLKSFLSSMVVVPGHPEHGPFYLVKGLLKASEKYSWKEIKGGKIELYLALVSTLKFTLGRSYRTQLTRCSRMMNCSAETRNMLRSVMSI